MEDDGPLLSIGELARRAGLPVRTIRFWSDAGVLPPAARTEGGRRLYDAAGVARLELVATLRELGWACAMCAGCWMSRRASPRSRPFAWRR